MNYEFYIVGAYLYVIKQISFLICIMGNRNKVTISVLKFSICSRICIYIMMINESISIIKKLLSTIKLAILYQGKKRKKIISI